MIAYAKRILKTMVMLTLILFIIVIGPLAAAAGGLAVGQVVGLPPSFSAFFAAVSGIFALSVIYDTFLSEKR